MILKVFTEVLTNRIRYIFSEIIRGTTIRKIEFITNAEELMSEKLSICIWYSEKPAPQNWIHIIPSGILNDNEKVAIPANVVWREDLPWFYQTTADILDWNSFDVPAMMFFMLSRAEEYELNPDELGRICGRDSLAFKHGFLEIPVVDLWKKQMFKQNGASFFHTSEEKNTLSVDIDTAYAWRYKSPGINALKLLNLVIRGRFSKFVEAVKSLNGTKKDPFDTTSILIALAKEREFDLIFFILSGKRSMLDKNLPVNHPAMRSLITELKKHVNIGLHPSYLSNRNQETLIWEKKELEGSYQGIIKHSRQHYLILKWPETYRRLILAGIEYDHSMFYHDKLGFRAGTSLSFNWYDLQNEQQTNLTVVPYVAMDVTLKKYLNLTVPQAKEKLRNIKDGLREQGLSFKILWHNSSMDEAEGWEGWTAVVQDAINF
jgi:hypothetical protein